MEDFYPDQTPLADTTAFDSAAGRYFALLSAIGHHLPRLGAEMCRSGRLSRAELRGVEADLQRLGRSFAALGLKYLLSNRAEGQGLRPALSIDRLESGLPVAAELLHLANDAVQARAALVAMPAEADLRRRMLERILQERRRPLALQHALAQRRYAEVLGQGGLFLARNDPQAQLLSGPDFRGRRRWLLIWSVYDAELNLPVLYLMELGEAGRWPLPQEIELWSGVTSYLQAQSLNWLRLQTIAQGVDAEFGRIEVLGLKRLHLGPFHAPPFTAQEGPLGAALSASVRAGRTTADWAMVWSIERWDGLAARREATGWFSGPERKIFSQDPFAAPAGAPRIEGLERFVLLPEALAERLHGADLPGLPICYRLSAAGRLPRRRGGLGGGET